MGSAPLPPGQSQKARWPLQSEPSDLSPGGSSPGRCTRGVCGQRSNLRCLKEADTGKGGGRTPRGVLGAWEGPRQPSSAAPQPAAVPFQGCLPPWAAPGAGLSWLGSWEPSAVPWDAGEAASAGREGRPVQQMALSTVPTAVPSTAPTAHAQCSPCGRTLSTPHVRALAQHPHMHIRTVLTGKRVLYRAPEPSGGVLSPQSRVLAPHRVWEAWVQGPRHTHSSTMTQGTNTL